MKVSKFLNFHQKNTKGIATIEFAMTAGIWVVILIGVVQACFYMIDRDRLGRSIDAGLEMVWQLDDETINPPQDRISRLTDGLSSINKMTQNGRFAVYFTVLGLGVDGSPSIIWQRSSGNANAEFNSKITVSNEGAHIGGEVFDFAGAEKLLVVEIYRDEMGLLKGGNMKYAFEMMYRR